MPRIRWGRLSGTCRESEAGATGRNHGKGDGKAPARRKEIGLFWRSRCMTKPVADVSFSVKATPKHSRKSSPQAPKHSSLVTGIRQKPSLDLDAFQDNELKKRVECKEHAKQCAIGNLHTKGGLSYIGQAENANKESRNVCADAFPGESKIGGHGGCSVVCKRSGCSDSYLKRATVHDKGREEHSLKCVVNKGAFNSCLDDDTVLTTGDKAREIDHIPHDVGLKDGNCSLQLKLIPPNLVRSMPKRMGDIEAVDSRQICEWTEARALFDEVNAHCPPLQKPCSVLQFGQNGSMKVLVSSWASLTSHGSNSDSTHQNSFSTCMSNLSYYSTPMNSVNERYFSCSSFSISKLLEGMELDSFSTGLSSKLYISPELQSLTSCCTSACSSSSLEHISEICMFECSPTSISTGSTSYVEHELHSSQEIKVLDGSTSMQGETSSRQLDRLLDMISLSRKPLEYTRSRVDGLVSDLKSEYIDIQRNAAAELRLLAKHDNSNRKLILNAGALQPLLLLLWSGDSNLQLDATTTLLNLSLNHDLKECLANEGAIEGLVGVLNDGLNETVKENAAATLAYLAVYETSIRKIGSAGAITPLVHLLERGSLRGKKDAAAALYKLSSLNENKREMLRARILRPLVELMYKGLDKKEDMVDKAMAVVTKLVSMEEGRVALVEEGGIMSLLQVIKIGSQRSQSLAMAILFQLCVHDRKHRLLVQQIEPLPTLMSIFKTANSRLKMQIAEIIDVLVITSG